MRRITEEDLLGLTLISVSELSDLELVACERELSLMVFAYSDVDDYDMAKRHSDKLVLVRNECFRRFSARAVKCKISRLSFVEVVEGETVEEV